MALAKEGTSLKGKKEEVMGREATAKQILELSRNFTDTLDNLGRDEAQRLIDNFDHVRTIQRGGLTDVMVVMMRCEVEIDYTKHLSTRYGEVDFEKEPHDLTADKHFMSVGYKQKWRLKKETLELVSFTRPITSIKEGVKRLAAYNLKPATIDHMIAFAAANPAPGWTRRDGILIYALGSVGILYKKPIGPFLFAPDNDRDEPRKKWSLDHFWHETSEKCICLSYNQWLLAVENK